MNVQETSLSGLYVLETNILTDNRGYFLEVFKLELLDALLPCRTWSQDNMSLSHKGVIRGLHFQNPFCQAKLITVARGEVFDVAVDIRLGSPTFGRWFGTLLSSINGKQMLLSEGFAHGFSVISNSAVVTYKCSEVYHRETEQTVLWNDSDIGIDWMITPSTISAKDESATRLKDFDANSLPNYDQLASNWTFASHV